jgi:L-serine/L-threonine ammonia-lyase
MISSSSRAEEDNASMSFPEVASEARRQNLFLRTPLIRSEPLSQITGRDVYLKLECLQSSGSFKDRGMAHLCWTLSTQQNVTKIISSSGGNAGLAAATIAKRLELECQVVVPVTTKPLVVQKLEQQLGATVQIIGDNWNQADAHVQTLVQQDTSGHTAYIPPYENPLLWTGHSTLVDEIWQEDSCTIFNHPSPATVIASVGGGGLLCGILEGLERYHSQHSLKSLSSLIHVVAAETKGASSFAQAWESGELVTLDSIDSIATSLGALQVSETALERSKSYQERGWGQVQTSICTDPEAVDACWQVRCMIGGVLHLSFFFLCVFGFLIYLLFCLRNQFARDHRMLVEPACGAALAVLYSERLRKELPPAGNGPIVVIVCGGSGVNIDLLQQWKKQFSL